MHQIKGEGERFGRSPGPADSLSGDGIVDESKLMGETFIKNRWLSLSLLELSECQFFWIHFGEVLAGLINLANLEGGR